MSKTNFFFKYLKNISNLINSLLEKNLNKLNFQNLSNLFKNNKIILTFVALFMVFLSYLLIPNFYKQSDISKHLSAELYNKFDLNFKFSQKIKYNIFPRPHFIINESTIFNNKSEISKIKKFKIFLSLDNFLSFKNIKLNDLIFENANFNLNKKNYNFFLHLLNKNFNNGNLIVKNSNIFFRNSEDEVLFINKILKIKYYYEPKESKNFLFAENEIFNIPFTMETYLSDDKNKIFSKFNLSLIKLMIENELIFNNEIKIGQIDFFSNKLKRTAEYQINKNNFEFYMFDKKDQPNKAYKGKFNLKPFYASLEGDLDEINMNYLLGSNAIISQLLKTEILNNKNIDFKLNITADSIYNNINFRNIYLNSNIQEGLIDIDQTKFKWRDYVDFNLSDTLIFVREGELVLDGKLIININNYNEIYKFLLTPKNYRNKLNKVDLNFTYNFDKKIAKLKDIKIDNNINLDVNKILNNVILKKDNFQNKIYLKNLLNDAFKSYAG